MVTVGASDDEEGKVDSSWDDREEDAVAGVTSVLFSILFVSGTSIENGSFPFSAASETSDDGITVEGFLVKDVSFL